MTRLCSLFSGIGGFEVGFARAGFETVMMCEMDASARWVLTKRFPDIPIRRDVKAMKSLPSCEVLVAGWPCQDLSQAGRTAGIEGDRSGLVSEVFRLLRSSRRKPEYIVLENVAFALHLQSGRALTYVTQEFENLGYAWAYRILDSRHFGLPQRRRRLFLLASRTSDPASILFDGMSAEPKWDHTRSMTGFYWTEGNTGIGWSPGAVPPLKGGSGLSIPSPPAIWDKSNSLFVVPGIGDAERMQGFRRGWTKIDDGMVASDRSRWRLVGNAVSVPVAEWIANRISAQSLIAFREPTNKTKRPNAAVGGPRMRTRQFHSIESPLLSKLVYLEDFPIRSASPLSPRAAKGFYHRITKSTLKTDPLFIRDLAAYIS